VKTVRSFAAIIWFQTWLSEFESLV